MHARRYPLLMPRRARSCVRLCHAACYPPATAAPLHRAQVHASIYPHVKPPGELASSWFFYAAVPYLLPSRFPLELPGQATLSAHYGVAAGARRARMLWGTLGLLLLLGHSNAVPNLRGTFVGIPYAYAFCAYGSVISERKLTAVCSASLHARAERTPIVWGDMGRDAFICAVVVAMLVAFVAWVPRRRVLLLTRIGTSSLYVYLFTTYFAVFTDALALPLLASTYHITGSGLALLLGCLVYCFVLMFAVAVAHEGLTKLLVRRRRLFLWLSHRCSEGLEAASRGLVRVLTAAARMVAWLTGERIDEAVAALLASRNGAQQGSRQSKPSSRRRRRDAWPWATVLGLAILSTRPTQIANLTSTTRSTVRRVVPIPAGSVERAPLALQVGLDHMLRGVALKGAMLTMLMTVANSTACYHACEAHPQCHKFTFREPILNASAHSTAAQPLCMLKGWKAKIQSVKKGVGASALPWARRVAVSGMINRTAVRRAHSHTGAGL